MKGGERIAMQEEKEQVNLVMFIREKDLNRIRNVFCDSFGLPRMESGNSTEFGNQTCSADLLIVLPSMGEDEEKFIQGQKNVVCGYFSTIESADEDIKINLIHHIRNSDAFVSILVEAVDDAPDFRENLETIIGMALEGMEELGGILLTEQGTVALDPYGKVILAGDGSSEMDAYFPFTLVREPEFLKDCTDRQKARRYENMKYLFDKGIYVCELPLNGDDDQITVRGKEEVARRLLGLLVVSLYSEAMLNPAENMDVPEARKFIENVMNKYSVKNPEEILTPAELAYIRDDAPEEKTMIDYSWNYEHVYTLEWVLGIADWNEPTDICNVPETAHNMFSFQSIEDICSQTVMRSKKEILDKADLVYRMDWAAVDARIHRMTGPAQIDHGVIQARHKTLNWMIRLFDAEWDDVDTPT